MKKILLTMIILFLISCSSSFVKSKIAQEVYNKTNPNASSISDQIRIGDSKSQCIQVEDFCSSKAGMYSNHGSSSSDNYYCTCYY